MIPVFSTMLPFVLAMIALNRKLLSAGLPVLAGRAYTGNNEVPSADDTVESPKEPGTKPPVKPSRY